MHQFISSCVWLRVSCVDTRVPREKTGKVKGEKTLLSCQVKFLLPVASNERWHCLKESKKEREREKEKERALHMKLGFFLCSSACFHTQLALTVINIDCNFIKSPFDMPPNSNLTARLLLLTTVEIVGSGHDIISLRFRPFVSWMWMCVCACKYV